MYTGLRVKCPLFLSDFNETWIFWTNLRKILKYQTYCKSMQWTPSCSMRTDRQTDITKLVVFFAILRTCIKRDRALVLTFTVHITQQYSTGCTLHWTHGFVTRFYIAAIIQYSPQCYRKHLAVSALLNMWKAVGFVDKTRFPCRLLNAKRNTQIRGNRTPF
jgi:hypothetical protein